MIDKMLPKPFKSSCLLIDPAHLKREFRAIQISSAAAEQAP
jgi:hypothetical protein